MGNSELSIPWRSTTVRTVLSSTLLVTFSIALISPGLPIYQETFGTTDAGASLLLTAILVPGIFLSPLAGLLADRLGRRWILIVSLLLWSLAGGAIVLRPPFEVILVLRFFQGVALAGIGVTTVALLSDAFEGVQLNAVFGVNTAALSVGAAVYPLVGGALVAVAWNAPFAMYLLGLPVALYALIALEEPQRRREARSLIYLRRVLSALSGREALFLYGSAFMIDFLLVGAVFTALPFLLKRTYGLSAVLIGAVIMVGEIASTVAATQNGKLAQRLSDYRIITTGFVATAIGLVGIWIASTPVLIALATIGYGVGWGLILPSIDAGVSDLVPTEFRAGALSLRGSASFAGRAGGPIAFASLADSAGYRPLLLVGGVLSFGSAFLLFVLAE